MNAQTTAASIAATIAPTTIILSANLLACIREFAGRKDIRHYLNAIHFCTKGGRVYLSASDGHMGAVLRSPEGVVQGADINWIVPIELFDKIGNSDVTLTFDPSSALKGDLSKVCSDAEKGQETNSSSWRCEVTLAQDAIKRSIFSLEAGLRFPSMGHLFPKETGNCAAQIDSVLLSRIHKAYAALKSGGRGSRNKDSSSGQPNLGFPTEPNSVVLLDFEDPNFTGLVMPLRGKSKADTVDWLDAYAQSHQTQPLKDQVKAIQAIKSQDAAAQNRASRDDLPSNFQVPQALLDGKDSVASRSKKKELRIPVSIPWCEAAAA